MRWTRSPVACACLSVWTCLTTLWLGASSAMADQFVLFDATFTFTKDDADNSKPSPSHYYVRDKLMNSERPTDWTSPVDYRLLLSVVPPASNADDNATWNRLKPYFETPAEFAQQFGEYPSPLKFYDGTPVKDAADWVRRQHEGDLEDAGQTG